MALTEKQAGAGTCPKVMGKDGDSCAASFIDIYDTTSRSRSMLCLPILREPVQDNLAEFWTHLPSRLCWLRKSTKAEAHPPPHPAVAIRLRAPFQGAGLGPRLDRLGLRGNEGNGSRCGGLYRSGEARGSSIQTGIADVGDEPPGHVEFELVTDLVIDLESLRAGSDRARPPWGSGQTDVAGRYASKVWS